MAKAIFMFLEETHESFIQSNESIYESGYPWLAPIMLVKHYEVYPSLICKRISPSALHRYVNCMNICSPDTFKFNNVTKHSEFYLSYTKDI